MKVCIVGAGTAGLCSARRALENHIEPTVFEQTGKIGGTWVFTDQVGLDEYGLDVHSSMYYGLRTNLPKEIMGYPDIPIIPPKEEQEKSYVSSNTIMYYLQNFADNFNLRKYIQFYHYILRIDPFDGKWEVTVKDLKTQNVKVELYDYVLVCNGHYHTPFYPHIRGSNLFKGRQVHSHDFRFANAFQGEDVLVIGAGPSGMDLCNEISKVANRVTLSHHLPEKPKTKFLDNVTQRCDVKEIDRNGVHFCDGSYETFSVIFYCTGYKYTFPFLTVDCGVYVEDNFVQPLYKHCINIRYPTMAFIGIPFYVCASQMMDLQARFAFKFFTCQKELPTQKEMHLDTEEEMTARLKKGYKKRQAHMMGFGQMDYYNELAKVADVEGIKPVMSKLHNESSERFLDNLLNFRNDVFEIIDDDMFIQCNE